MLKGLRLLVVQMLAGQGLTGFPDVEGIETQAHASTHGEHSV